MSTAIQQDIHTLVAPLAVMNAHSDAATNVRSSVWVEHAQRDLATLPVHDDATAKLLIGLQAIERIMVSDIPPDQAVEIAEDALAMMVEAVRPLAARTPNLTALVRIYLPKPRRRRSCHGIGGTNGAR